MIDFHSPPGIYCPKLPELPDPLRGIRPGSSPGGGIRQLSGSFEEVFPLAALGLGENCRELPDRHPAVLDDHGPAVHPAVFARAHNSEPHTDERGNDHEPVL